MAGNTLYVMEAVNLFAGDHDPTASKHLTITEMQLPALTEIYQDHHAGGSKVQIEVAVGVMKLEPTFKLTGWDPALLGLFGVNSREKKVFTAYGVVRDKRTGEAKEVKAVIEGRLGKIEPEAFQRGELQSHDYAINEVTHYEVWFAGNEKVYWDFFSTEWRLDGVEQNADERNILRISG